MKRNKKEIKVQMDFGITKKIHSLYNSYFTHPPKRIIYSRSEFILGDKKIYSCSKRFYHLLKKIIPLSPRFMRGIKDSLRKEGEEDLIHFANHIGKTKKPFVADYEDLSAILREGYQNKKLSKDIRELLLQKNFKFLLPINKTVLMHSKKYLNQLPVKIKQKVLYPVTFVEEKFRKRIKKEDIVLFGGSSNIKNDKIFYTKGGYETLMAFEDLAKKYQKTKFIYLGNVPSNIKIKPLSNLIVRETLPLKELYSLLNKSKIFVQPSYLTPSMMFLIAMFFKLPIITYDSWANSEYVDEKNGVLIKPENSIIGEENKGISTSLIIKKIRKDSKKNSKKIMKEISKLIKDEERIKKLGNNGFKRVIMGKFSIKRRNEKLREIYEECIN